MGKPVVALMYDFDKTLSPRNMQDYGFMDGLGMSPDEFWTECTHLTRKNNMDSILSYMYLMLEKGKSKMLTKRENFNALGKSVKLFPGVRSWFDRVNDYCETRGLQCEHYIISSGLKEMIEGTKIARYFNRIFASCYMYDEQGRARRYRPAQPEQLRAG